jgi:hypothetical protein
MPEMKNIDIGSNLESFNINGDPNRVITFNPADQNILVRLNNVSKEVGCIKETDFIPADGVFESELDEIAHIVKAKDAFLREKVDYIFGYPVSDVIFGKESVDENMLIRFFEAAFKHIRNVITLNNKAAVDKYTATANTAKKRAPKKAITKTAPKPTEKTETAEKQ